MKSIHDPNYIQMINCLKQLRKSNNIPQKKLADKIGWDYRDISKVESFIRRLDLIELCYWLEALEYSLEDFLRDIGKIE